MRKLVFDFLVMIAIAILAALLLSIPTRVEAAECIPEPESQWAPAGWICPPIYGTGTASTWDGPGVARNDCVFPWNDCAPIVVSYPTTGRSVVVTPTMWCHCYVNTVGPNGETQRIVDLDPDTMEALGIPARGLWDVVVCPVDQSVVGERTLEACARTLPPTLLPDTAMH